MHDVNMAVLWLFVLHFFVLHTACSLASLPVMLNTYVNDNHHPSSAYIAQIIF